MQSGQKKIAFTDVKEALSYDGVMVTVFIVGFLEKNIFRRGIGLRFNDKKRAIFLFDSESSAETLWRGMEILRRLIPFAKSELLSDGLVLTCFHAGDETRHDLGKFSNAYRILGGYQVFNHVRRDVLAASCDEPEIAVIKKFLHETAFLRISHNHLSSEVSVSAV